MKRRRNRSASADPFTAWTNFAVRNGEMMWAAAQVIGHRTARMASAGAIPDARDRKEFALMGQEKLEAATESAQAIAAQMMRVNQQFGMLAWEQWTAGAQAWMALTTSATVAQSGARQAKMVRDTMRNSAQMASQLSGSAAHLAEHGLAPIHSRATANAKRLRKG